MAKLICTRLAVLVLVSTAASQAAASQIVQRQQARYQHLKSTWEQVQAPKGISLHPGPTGPRTSGVRPSVEHIHNVNFYLTRDLGFHVIDLAAELVPNRKNQPVVVDDVRSYSLRVLQGRVLLRPRDLNALFNEDILNYDGSPLRHLSFSTQDGMLVEKGSMRLWGWFPGFWLPLYLKGPLHVGKGGKLVYVPRAVHAIHVPVGGLVHFTHLPLDWLLTLNRPGARLKGSKIYLNPRTVFPPPRIRGHVSKVQATPRGVVLTFSSPHSIHFTDHHSAGSYIWIQAGDVRFYNMLMVNAHILMKPEKAGKTLSFSLYGYRRQVARGVLKMPINGSLIVSLPSYKPPGG